MKRHITILCCLVALCALATPPQWAVDTFANKPYLRHASLGVAVADVSTGELVASHLPEQSDITASTMKTVTSFSSLMLLGPDFRFATPVYAIGDIDDERLHGDLVVVGSGDPTIGSQYLPADTTLVQRIVAALQARGITRIDGHIKVDKSLYDGAMPTSGGWEVEDLGWNYGAGVHPFAYRDNTIDLHFDVDKDGTHTLFTIPTVPGLTICDNTTPCRSGRNRDCIVEYGSSTVTLYGQVSPGDQGFTIVNPLPDNLFIAELEAALKHAGIDVKHKDKHHDATRTLLTTHYSPALPDIITSLLARSDNMYSHALLRAIAVRDTSWAAKAGAVRNIDSMGVDAVGRLFKSLGVDTEALFMRDGSGLARSGKASPHFFTDMLTVALKQDLATPLHTLMPQAGTRVGGPLNGSELARRIVLKSGSMNAVQCFVGYYPADKPRYAWAILANNYNCSRERLRDDMGTLLVNLFGKE